MQLADAAAGVVPVARTEAQPLQPQATVEHQLFDYLVEVGKGLGKTGVPNDPSALVGNAMHSLEGIVRQAQSAFAQTGAQTGPQTGPQATAPGDAQPSGRDGAQGKQNTDALLDRAISFMWAAANVSVAINSVTAATGSVNTLIKQQ
jgi:hypothetical protein